MERWTQFVLRFRWPILAGWLAVLLVGGFAFTHLSSLLSNKFSVPGTDSERARTILERALRRPERRRVHGRLPAPRRGRSAQPTCACRAFSTTRRETVPDRTAAPARPGRPACPLRRRRLDAPPREGEGLHGRPLRALPHGGGVRVLRHRPGRDPARPRPDLLRGPAEGRSRSRCRSRCSSCSPSSGSRSP